MKESRVCAHVGMSECMRKVSREIMCVSMCEYVKNSLDWLCAYECVCVCV